MTKLKTAGFRSLALVALGVTSVIASLVLAGCGGGSGESGAENTPETTTKYAQVKSTLTGTCAICHNSTGIDALILDTTRLAADSFTADQFPDNFFPSGLTQQSVAELKKNASPAEDAEFPSGMPQRKAWILHELHELKALLAESVPPDFTTRSSFDAFARLGKPGTYEGCEIIEKLDLGHGGDPEGMPPLWSENLTGLLGVDFVLVTEEERQRIKDYTNAVLPGSDNEACK